MALGYLRQTLSLVSLIISAHKTNDIPTSRSRVRIRGRRTRSVRSRKYRDYGNLAGRNVEDMIAGARIEVAPYKRNPADFVLWKPSGDNEPVGKQIGDMGVPAGILSVRP